MKSQQEWLLTILIPVYNAEKYLVRCLDSIVKQNEFGLYVDLVIINDGSKDNSLAIILEYAKDCPNAIKVLNQENMGIGPTRNNLINNADGRYFWFVDADDYVDENSLSVIVKSLQLEDVDMLLLGYNWIVGGNVNRILYRQNFQSGLDMAGSGIYNNSLWIRVIKRDLVTNHNIRFQKYVMGEDFDFLFKLLPNVQAIKCIDLPLYNYVFNPKSAVGNAEMRHKMNVAEDSIKCIENNCELISRFGLKEKNSLKIALNLFIIGFLYALYVDSFSFEYKKRVCHRLLSCGALPIKPLPKKAKQKLFVVLMNAKFSRNILLSLHCNNNI